MTYIWESNLKKFILRPVKNWSSSFQNCFKNLLQVFPNIFKKEKFNDKKLWS